MWLHRRAMHLLLLIPVLGMPLLARGQASGGLAAVDRQPCGTPAPVLNAANQPVSNPSNLVDAAGTLYFTVPGASGTELWKSDGTPAGTVRVRPTLPWETIAVLDHFTAVGTRVFFTVTTSVPSIELWTSDGTALGTRSLKSFLSGGLGLQSDFTPVGNLLYFSAKFSNSQGFELWSSDGLPNGTQLVKDIQLGSGDSSPSELTEFNGQLYFVADDGAGNQLWRSDGTNTVMVQAINPGGDSLASSLTVMGGMLYFTATDGLSPVTLWKSNGTNVFQKVAPTPLANSTEAPANLTAAGNKLFFRFANGASGSEVWVTDGTEANTHIVREIASNGFSSDPQQLTAVGETVYFLANDGSTGQEPWRSDGTVQGTTLVRDFVSGSPNPANPKLVAGPGVLLAQINDNVWGSELWKIDAVGEVRLTDIAPMAASSTPHEMTISGGRLYFVATDSTPTTQLYVLPLTQVDCSVPDLSCPPDQTVEAINERGVLYTSLPYRVSDDAVAAPRVSSTHPLEGLFPLGDTPIDLKAADAAGNSKGCTFHIFVKDRTAPWLWCPDPTEGLDQEATQPDGAVVNYFVVASDAVASNLVPNYSRPPGAAFPLGKTTVVVTASDGPNTAQCQFPVTIHDTVPPSLKCPQDIVLEATTAEPVPIDYVYTATDAVTPQPELITDHPPGSLFPVGDTHVDLTVRDEALNTASCSFWVRNVDSEPPTISCPAPQQVVASRPEGAEVRFPAAVATDNLGSVDVSYSQEPGSFFPVGETVVTATATDAGQHSVSCDFTVTVGEYVRSDGGCQAGASGGALGWLLLVLTPLWARRRAARVAR